MLRSITRDQMQTFLDKKAETLSRSIVDHLRWDLNNVFKTALADGLVDSNPKAKLFTPPCKPEGEKRRRVAKARFVLPLVYSALGNA